MMKQNILTHEHEEIEKYKKAYNESGDLAKYRKTYYKSSAGFLDYYINHAQENAAFLEAISRRQLAIDFNRTEQELEQEALEELEDERSNYIQFIDKAYSKKYWEYVFSFATSLIKLFKIRSYWTEWKQIYELALEAARKTGDSWVEAQISSDLGGVYRLFGRRDDAIEMCKYSRSIFHQLGERGRSGEAIVLNTLGNVYRAKGSWLEAIEVLKESIKIFRELQDPRGEATALDSLGQVYTKQHRSDDAEQILTESLRIRKELGDRFELSITYNNLGKVYIQQGRLDEAEEILTESLHINRVLGARQGLGVSLNELGEVYRLSGQWDKAIEMYEESMCVKRDASDPNGEGLTLMNLAILYEQQEHKEKALDFWREALGKLYEDSPSYKQVKEKLLSEYNEPDNNDDNDSD